MKNDELKFYLLAELSGWNCSSYAFKAGPEEKNSDSYKILVENVEQAKTTISKHAEDLVDGFNSLNFDCKTVKDVFILDTKMNYLALHSYPEFYINPLSIDPNYKGELTSIGELMFNYHGKDVSLNDIIFDDKETLSFKKEQISNQLDYYLDDMNNLVYFCIGSIHDKTNKDLKFNTKTLADITDIVIFIFVHFVLFFIYVYKFDMFLNYVYKPQPTVVFSYIAYILPISIFIYDIFFTIFHIYKARISEPYNYAIRFLKKNSSKVFFDIKNERDKMYNYIISFLENRTTPKNDITAFSKLSSSFIDIKAVLNVSSLKKRKSYRVLHSLATSFQTLAFAIALMSFIIFILGIIFNVSI